VREVGKYPRKGNDIGLGGDGKPSMLEVDHVTHAVACGREQGEKEQGGLNPVTVRLGFLNRCYVGLEIVLQDCRGWHGESWP